MAHRSAICLIVAVCMVPNIWAQAPVAERASTGAPTAAPAAGSELRSYTVPAGTRILLSLRHEISTRVAKPGDALYLVSDFPVVQDGAVVIPAGMYVRGTIDRVERPGKVKGRAQLQMHLTSMIFPNGAEIAIPGPIDTVPGSTGAKVKNSEGTIEQSGSVGHDVQTITTTTAEGAGIGGLVGLGTGSVGMTAGIGAGAGAAAGILTTLFTRGNDIVFPQGTTLEMVLSRPIVVRQEQLAGIPGSTGMTMTAPVANGLQQSQTAGFRPSN